MYLCSIYINTIKPLWLSLKWVFVIIGNIISKATISFWRVVTTLLQTLYWHQATSTIVKGRENARLRCVALVKKKEGKTEDSHLWYLFYLNSLCLGRGASTKNRTERATPSTNHSFCKTPQPVLNHTCSILIPQTLLKSNIVSTRSSCRGQILFDDSFSGSIILAVIGGTCYKFASKNDFSSNTEELISRKTPISTQGKVPNTKVSLCSVYRKRDARQQEDIAEIPVLVPHWSYEIFASQNFSYVHPSLPT